ncbi:unnamed protein product [Prorocentrum cordatum]|uniref:Autophagy-related protein 9 n=1 Tax=Prorocentrum cordatum TaxID=2364126 RepID=A0ABN9T5D6_9DINO|nr:unnamed protein product [Polarella glacialis]
MSQVTELALQKFTRAIVQSIANACSYVYFLYLLVDFLLYLNFLLLFLYPVLFDSCLDVCAGRPQSCSVRRSTTSSSTEYSSQRSWRTHWSSRSLRGSALTSWWWSPEGSTRIRACVPFHVISQMDVRSHIGRRGTSIAFGYL